MLAEKIRNIRPSDQPPFILVIGDAMIDHYIWGQANRLSPEAPVPVVEARSETFTLGGAANVALNLQILGVKTALACLAGQDDAHDQLRVLLQESQVDNLVFAEAERFTTQKTRVMAGSHQLVRIDRESTHALSAENEPKIMEALEKLIGEATLILLSDYNKGMLSPGLCGRIITLAAKQGKKIIVDPKGKDYSKYAGAFIIKPNRKELAEASGMSALSTDEELISAAQVIIGQTDAKYIIVTLSEEGIAIIGEGRITRMPVKATNVYDVTGAGDTVLATLAFGLAHDLPIEDACEMANHAAAIALRKVGNAAVSVHDILENLLKND
ncbi:MAG: D-glycero-beta-D-manno-heptose-7-phosphate kinase [Mucilaginibacter polytrichastri]|nr:D-glycero-beta-D-manno-heptose-7-phosphate kinase [Mucilaginibacter polytrichastri]